ncbi:MAG: Delta-aminolevulinic acid dehydratase [Chlamydiae bacterium]|nr:Delta-aminolevulinic acid dehydratase [Chlamydiota bacterium]
MEPTQTLTPPYFRPRRNRKSPAIRRLVQETLLTPSDFVYPQFILSGSGDPVPIASMPGIYRLPLEALLHAAEKTLQLGIPAMALFPVINPELKDPHGSEALNPNGILPQTISALKKRFPELCLITDIALDPYHSHGHDGLVGDAGEVLNDETLERLAQMALVQAEAGVDMVAPSDMMDGRVRVIRERLDSHGYTQVSILSYAAKYASSFYGPFRDALSSSPSKGDKKGYQMDPANSREALLEATLDIEEGADILMVKPALPYLDILCKIREITHLPLSAYHVSGEYAMVMAAAQKGWLDADQVFHESLLSIKRAGADMIFTYAAHQIAPLL